LAAQPQRKPGKHVCGTCWWVEYRKKAGLSVDEFIEATKSVRHRKIMEPAFVEAVTGHFAPGTWTPQV
jgi:hypothetical protein